VPNLTVAASSPERALYLKPGVETPGYGLCPRPQRFRRDGCGRVLRGETRASKLRTRNLLPNVRLLQFCFFLRKEQPALVQLRVFSVQREKLLVVPALNDLPPMKNQDLIRMPHS
jgi:hypothetical protein